MVAAAALLFLGIVVWMLRHPRPPPKKARRPDLGVLHALQGMIYLIVAAGVGGTAMPTWGESLEPEQIWAIAYYVESVAKYRGTEQGAQMREDLNRLAGGR